jgi:hypothetical protein
MFKKKRINVARAAALANKVRGDDVPEKWETVDNPNFARCRMECGVPYERNPDLTFEENMRKHMDSRCTARTSANPKGKWLGWVDEALEGVKHLDHPENEIDYDPNVDLINEAIDTVNRVYVADKYKHDAYTGPRLSTLAQAQVEKYKD